MAEAALKQEPISNHPDDEAVIAVNLSKIRVAQDEAASHHGSLRNVLKHAEGKGVHLKAAKRALSIVKSGDAEAWLEETRRPRGISASCATASRKRRSACSNTNRRWRRSMRKPHWMAAPPVSMAQALRNARTMHRPRPVRHG